LLQRDSNVNPGARPSCPVTLDAGQEDDPIDISLQNCTHSWLTSSAKNVAHAHIRWRERNEGISGAAFAAVRVNATLATGGGVAISEFSASD
jgi:hypothetical protein